MSVVAAARRCLGVRFRAQGRDATLGLDCVGLVAVALAGAGRTGDVADAYAMRRGDADGVAALLAGHGLRRVSGRAAGDVVLAASGAGQVHLAIWTGAGVIHADAMLRRVVERPGAMPWPVLGYWRWEG